MTRVKICGMTRGEDAIAAAEAGVDAIGFVLDDGPRAIGVGEVRSIVRDLPPFVRTVGVFRHADPRAAARVADRARVDVIQLHGDEPAALDRRAARRWIQRFRVVPCDTRGQLRVRIGRCPGAVALLDPGAGNGVAFPWELARELGRPVIVAGGLEPANVGRAIREARPYAVDVSSGVEDAPGRKNHDRMRAFVEAVRREDARAVDR